MLQKKQFTALRTSARLTMLLLFSITTHSCVYAQNISTKHRDAEIKSAESNLGGFLQVDGEPLWTLSERMKFYHVHGVSIAVIKDYNIIWAKGYGWADSAEQRPVTIETRFQAGSISKSLNSLGAMTLVQQGKIDLDTDINNYLKSWKFPYDSISKGRKITLRNLLSHSAGLTVQGFPGYEQGAAVPTVVQILNGEKPANTPAVRSAFQPSLKYQYSGGGTTISQLIIQDVSGKNYDQYMWEKVLRPLQMNRSSYTQPPAANTILTLATGYYNDGKPVSRKFLIYPEQAAAGLWTTPSDLAKFVIETQLAYIGKSRKVLSQENTIKRLTPFIDSAAALGSFIANKKGFKYFNHGGVDEGFVSQYVGSIEGGYGVVVMSNSYNTAILDEIINSVATTYGWKNYYTPIIKKLVVVPDTTLESYIGKYQLAPQAIITVSKLKNQLSVQLTGQQAFEIFPETEGRFFLKVIPAVIDFIRNEKGGVSKLILHQNGRDKDAPKIP